MKMDETGPCLALTNLEELEDVSESSQKTQKYHQVVGRHQVPCLQSPDFFVQVKGVALL